MLVQRGLRIASAAQDEFRAILAAGLSLVIGVQAFIIAGGNLKLIPLTGITLPFVSYGGSSLLANAVIVGLLHRAVRARRASRSRRRAESAACAACSTGAPRDRRASALMAGHARRSEPHAYPVSGLGAVVGRPARRHRRRPRPGRR